MDNTEHSSPVAIVAHDAGGAAILASYVAREKLDCRFAVAGPAIGIFEEIIGPFAITPLQAALNECSWVLTGTGWQTDLEWRGIYKARQAGKRVVTFLDHWVNYPGRFVRQSISAYPDEVWVGDRHALQLAHQLLPLVPVRLVENPYFSYFVEQVKRLPEPSATNGMRVLFVSENINRPNLNQDDLIRYFMSNLEALDCDIEHIVIRPHPSENSHKFNWARQEFAHLVSLSNGVPLVDDVAQSHIVVGASTMAMVLACLVGKRVISCIPDKKIPFSLPFEKIEQFEQMIAWES